MANLKTITATNSVLMLAIGTIVPVPQKIEGFSSDAAFAFDDETIAEIVAGIDGNMSAGYVYTPTPQKITIMPNSRSYDLFALWRSTQKTLQEIVYANGSLSLPAIGVKATLTKGVLTVLKAAPTVAKTLQPIEYTITWESVTASPI